jgi:hypothetical protein
MESRAHDCHVSIYANFWSNISTSPPPPWTSSPPLTPPHHIFTTPSAPTPNRMLSCLRRYSALHARYPKSNLLEATFTSTFHNRAFTSHSTPAKNPTSTRSSTISSNATAQGETAPPRLPLLGNPLGTIRASLHSHHLPKWGLLIYRCDYRSDATWNSFMATLH